MKDAYQLFQDYLIGDFNNRAQVEAEQAAGQQVHPFAIHVNRLFTDRITDRPADFQGCFILEESYYTYPGQEQTIKPHLFKVEPFSASIAQMTPMQMPSHWPLSEIRNDNPALHFSWSELQAIPWFAPAHYRREGDLLKVHHPNDLGNGKRFTLTETFSDNRLEVMELMEENGQRLTPYATPIIYDRLPKNDQ